MTSKFSRRSTRAQKPPVVCKSTPPGVPKPRKLGTNTTLNYDHDDGVYQSHFANELVLTNAPNSQAWSALFTDEQGHKCQVDYDIQALPGQASGTISIIVDPLSDPIIVIFVSCAPQPGDPGWRPWLTPPAAIDNLFGTIGEYTLRFNA